jgi:RNA polymerase sigma-70 factor, ECF subfamily
MAGMNRAELRLRWPDSNPATPETTAGERDGDLPGLLARVARGDREAFGAVCRTLGGPVYGVIRQMLRDPAQSEQVAHEVLLEVWRTASRFDPARGSAAAWVLTMAHRRAADRVRQGSAGTRREARPAPHTVTESEGALAEVVEVTLDRVRVLRCLDGLTELQRESIKLAYYRGYSGPQVAALLGVTPGTVQTRIRDGLIRMRDSLEVTW